MSPKRLALLLRGGSRRVQVLGSTQEVQIPRGGGFLEEVTLWSSCTEQMDFSPDKEGGRRGVLGRGVSSRWEGPEMSGTLA